MSELLRNVISIPERTSAEDYVLRLTSSVEDDRLAATLDDYVVTPAIAEAFDQALNRVADAVTNGISRAAFLKGSFGSGKSHFMAVLYALLRHEPRARDKEGLSDVIARHDDVLQDKKLLPLTFHLLGAESMESAIFSAYLTQIQRLHPGAPLPALHESAQLLIDAENLRMRMGDEAFFASLDGEESDADDPWGNVLGAASWTADRYHAARSAAPGDRARQDLVSALVSTHFSSYVRQAEFLDLDTGLAAMSAHAQSLGYDAVVLFLDEVVLWLAFGVRDEQFFRREAQKLSKLVEGGAGQRPIPLVSFVARQLDLRKWFADSGASGSQQQALDQAFKHQEGRFGQITLGDDNLAHVAQRRLLRPVDDEAQAVLDAAFDGLSRRPAVWDVLLDGANTDDSHRGSDERSFRRTYPFSPALISTLRSLASVMQRDRTALKVMQQMLVDRRGTLTVDDVIPVGDAFDYLVTGSEVLDPESAALFRSAESLWSDRLRPLIMANYGLSAHDLEQDDVPPGYRADERLAKTLLLSAVAPNVPALKSLTAERLASLNHGSIVSPLPGQEAQAVLSKVRNWAREVPELRVGTEGRNPLIAVTLADVNYESIVERAKGEQNEGRLRELIKGLVAEAMGIEIPTQGSINEYYTHKVIWRGSAREVDVLFGNVRDRSWVSDDLFEARPGTWRFIIDFPFDEPGHSIAEDRARLDQLHARSFVDNTVVWLPHFFSEARLRDARRLVILKYLLDGTGERYASYADHLAETDRIRAKSILESQRATLTHALERAIEVAYDAATASATADDIVRDEGHDLVLTSFNRGFSPKLSATSHMRAAFDHLVDQAFSAMYPSHPKFEPGDVEVRRKELSVLVQYVDEALADPERRIPLRPDAAPVRRLAGPLGVGLDAETHFLMGDDRFTTWGHAISRGMGSRAAALDEPVSVPELRAWIQGVPAGEGLRSEVADVVILAWAALRRRAWYQHGAPIPAPQPGQLAATMELREQPLPTHDEWRAATRKAGSIFGLTESGYMTPTAVANLANAVQEAARALEAPARRLGVALEEAGRHIALPAEGPSQRVATAEASLHVVQVLQNLGGVALIKELATLEVPDEQRVARSLKTADAVAHALETFEWSSLERVLAAAQEEGPGADEAAHIVNTLRQALAVDELVTPLAPALGTAVSEAIKWLNRQVAKPDGPTSPAARPHASGSRRLARGESLDDVTRELQSFREEHDDAEVIVEWRLGR